VSGLREFLILEQQRQGVGKHRFALQYKGFVIAQMRQCTQQYGTGRPQAVVQHP